MSRACACVSVCVCVPFSLFLFRSCFRSLSVFILCPFLSIFPFYHFLSYACKDTRSCMCVWNTVQVVPSIANVKQNEYTKAFHAHTHTITYSSTQRGLKFGKMSVPHSELNGKAECFLYGASRMCVRVCVCLPTLYIGVSENWGCALHISKAFVNKCTRTHKWKSKQYFIKQARTLTHTHMNTLVEKHVHTNGSHIDLWGA